MQSRFLLLFSLAMTMPAATSSAQSRWVVTPEIGLASFSGASSGTTGGVEVSGHPSGMTTGGLRVEKENGRVHLGFGLLAGAPGFEAAAPEGPTVTLDDQFTMIELRPELILPVTRLGEGGSLRAVVGPVATLSHITQGSTRLLPGGLAAASLVLPVSSRLEADIRYELALTQSPFRAGDLPSGVSARPMWRRRLALGLRMEL